jgi:hypothetical protein
MLFAILGCLFMFILKTLLALHDVYHKKEKIAFFSGNNAHKNEYYFFFGDVVVLEIKKWRRERPVKVFVCEADPLGSMFQNQKVV